MTALALVDSGEVTSADTRFEVALSRASIALADAVSTSDLYEITIGVDGVKRAMKAFEVSASVQREANSLFLRSVHALGCALNAEYPIVGDQKIAAATGYRLVLVRSAISLARCDKSLDEIIAHFEKHDMSVSLSQIYTLVVFLNRPPGAPSVHRPAVPQSATAVLSYAQTRCDDTLDSLNEAVHLGIATPDKAKLRSLRVSAALIIEAVDLLLAGERSRAMSVLGSAS